MHGDQGKKGKKLALTPGLLEAVLFLSLLWFDLAEAVEDLGCTLPARPTAGEMDRAGTFGGRPDSAPGDRRIDRCEGPGACIVGDTVLSLPLQTAVTGKGC